MGSFRDRIDENAVGRIDASDADLVAQYLVRSVGPV
jgi:hypothetical protein